MLSYHISDISELNKKYSFQHNTNFDRLNTIAGATHYARVTARRPLPHRHNEDLYSVSVQAFVKKLTSSHTTEATIEQFYLKHNIKH